MNLCAGWVHSGDSGSHPETPPTHGGRKEAPPLPLPQRASVLGFGFALAARCTRFYQNQGVFW